MPCLVVVVVVVASSPYFGGSSPTYLVAGLLAMSWYPSAAGLGLPGTHVA